MKKIVIISSSPRRKGNSQVLCEQFAKGALENGNEVEIINLNDYTIAPCLACEYCRNHDQQCVRKDDAALIIEKMIQADVWVLASPVYFYGVSAQMKLLIDRFFAREYTIRESEKRKEVYYIITSGAPHKEDVQVVIDSLRGFIKVLRTIDEKGIVEGMGAFKLKDVYEHPSFKQAYDMAKSIK